MKQINPNHLVPMNVFEDNFINVVTDVVYADPHHDDNHFSGLYHPEANLLWADRDIAAITILASEISQSLHGWRFKVNDCLRPIEAQEKMLEYGFHPALVSTPGSGGHPRAMAIDIEPIYSHGGLVDMGTAFDHFVDDPENGDNPAARNFTKSGVSLTAENAIWQNRQKLEFAMRKAATTLGHIIYPLPQEWWDFRFKSDISDQFAPLRENDLRPYQRMIAPDLEGVKKIHQGIYPDELSESLTYVQNKVQEGLQALSLTKAYKIKHNCGTPRP